MTKHKSWTKHNQQIFNKKLTDYAQNLETRIKKVCHDLAEMVLSYIEDSSFRPQFTSNLADGTGIGVYFNGALKEYMPTPRAEGPAAYNGEEVWGKDYLADALTYASMRQFSKGVWVVLFSTVPYAVRVDEKGTKYVSGERAGQTKTEPGFFSERLVEDMRTQFKSAFAKEFPNVVNQLSI